VRSYAGREQPPTWHRLPPPCAQQKPCDTAIVPQLGCVQNVPPPWDQHTPLDLARFVHSATLHLMLPPWRQHLRACLARLMQSSIMQSLLLFFIVETRDLLAVGWTKRPPVRDVVSNGSRCRLVTGDIDLTFGSRPDTVAVRGGVHKMNESEFLLTHTAALFCLERVAAVGVVWSTNADGSLRIHARDTIAVINSLGWWRRRMCCAC
jgi:hypothetical protein